LLRGLADGLLAKADLQVNSKKKKLIFLFLSRTYSRSSTRNHLGKLRLLRTDVGDCVVASSKAKRAGEEAIEEAATLEEFFVRVCLHNQEHLREKERKYF